MVVGTAKPVSAAFPDDNSTIIPACQSKRDIRLAAGEVHILYMYTTSDYNGWLWC